MQARFPIRPAGLVLTTLLFSESLVTPTSRWQMGSGTDRDGFQPPFYIPYNFPFYFAILHFLSFFSVNFPAFLTFKALYQFLHFNFKLRLCQSPFLLKPGFN
jgi:hypothetical protein